MLYSGIFANKNALAIFGAIWYNVVVILFGRLYMKRKISLILVICMILSMVLSLTSCDAVERFIAGFNPPVVNGVKLSEYVIVFDADGADYNERAAKYIQERAFELGVRLDIVDDSAAPADHEIVVGETSRVISKVLGVDTTGVEFAILAMEGSIALEGDYFVIAAAAYFFMETYAPASGYESTVPEEIKVHQPIAKEAKNFIMLIGDGMGVYQTLLFDFMENNCDYSDGEDLFYGYMLPYQGYSMTESLSGITDSAAGGTALACGYKTYNEYIGRDANQNDIKSLTELAIEMGKSGAVMSTENKTGATPSSFSAHADSRNSTAEIMASQTESIKNYGMIVDCGYDYYTVTYVDEIIEQHITDTLASVSANEKGFFLMYEEAHIDKHCHNNKIDKTFLAVARFNQAIGRFMEFAFYNPDTLVLITADHETGMLLPDADGKLHYNDTDHSAANVPIFAWGKGAELFDGATIENIQIAHTVAALMGEDNFGDQSEYKSLTK